MQLCPELSREVPNERREHCELWWFYTRLTKSEPPSGAPSASVLPEPLGGAAANLIKNSSDLSPLCEDVPSGNQFYGSGAICFSTEETARQFYEESRAGLKTYFERDGFDLEYLNFNLFLIRTKAEFHLSLITKPHTILARHREESIENSATSIIWVGEESYPN